MLSTNVSIEQKIILPELEEKNITLYVKRDDMIHPFISGNKWRKLKYNYEVYKKKEYKGMVTFGGAFSNHLLATAALCAEVGIPSVGIVRGEEAEGLNPVLILCRTWGMKLEFVSREAYKMKEELASIKAKEGYFIIPEGGENKEGVLGCSDMVKELENTYNHCFCASGTGCTFAGILEGFASIDNRTKVHSIPVLKNGGFMKEVLQKYDVKSQNYEIHTQYHFGGYAKTSPDQLKFISYFAQKTGILTDPVYTSKMFMAIVDLARNDFFKAGETILALHTGGLTGILSEKMLKAMKEINS